LGLPTYTMDTGGALRHAACVARGGAVACGAWEMWEMWVGEAGRPGRAILTDA